MTGGPQRIEVIVDRLVLHGVPGGHAADLVAAFELHLAALASGGDAGGPTHDRPGRGGHADVTDATALGRHAAAEVWRTARAAIGDPATGRGG